MSVKFKLNYEGGMRCTTTHPGNNKTITTDPPVDGGGKGEFFSPTDMLAVALASCEMTFIGWVAEREKIDITGTTVDVEKEMATSGERRVGKIDIRVQFPKDVEIPENIRTKMERAADKCPVKLSLHPEVKLNVEYIY